MASKDFTTPHSKAVATLSDQGWLTGGFTSFVFIFQFARRVISCAPSPLSPEDVARRLFADYRQRALVNSKWRLAPSVKRIAEDSGRAMTTGQVLARMKRYQMPIRRLRRVPDAWRLADGPGVVIEIAEVSDTHPVFRDRLYDYSLFNDSLPDAEIDGVRLIEINANSGAAVQHDLDSVLVDACCSLAPVSA